MFFNTNRLTKKQLRNEICFFAKYVGVRKVIFNNKARRVYGTYNATTNTMFLSLKQTKKQMLNTMFHELGHFYSVLNKRWIKFHFNLYKTSNLDRMFCIENKIEKIGKDLWNKNVSKTHWGNYKYFYLKSKKTQITNLFNH